MGRMSELFEVLHGSAGVDRRGGAGRVRTQNWHSSSSLTAVLHACVRPRLRQE